MSDELTNDDRATRLATSPVTMRPVVRHDAPALIRAPLDSRAMHAPWAEPFIDRAGFNAWFAAVQSGRRLSLLGERDGRIVGVVNISEIVRGSFCSAYLGYHGMAGATGGGAMTQLVRLAVGYAFEVLGLHRVEANIQPGNLRSRALVQRLGFRLEGFSPRYLRIGGVWCDHERWAKLADE
jgi:ribosomal-protein-alanine N-acetyltransferase